MYKTEKIEVRISPADKRLIQAEAKRQGLTNSDLMRNAALKTARAKLKTARKALPQEK
jgi:uncharacterized protein (DUF1778 family)